MFWAEWRKKRKKREKREGKRGITRWKKIGEPPNRFNKGNGRLG